MIIYKTTNLINNKIYIGQDSNNNPDYIGSGKIIGYAIKKYNKENFIKEILEYCTLENLDEREIYWIDKLNSRDHKIGYNISIGGNAPMKGLKQTKQTIEKRRKSNTGKKRSIETCLKISKANKGQISWAKGIKKTKETCEKMSKSKKGIEHTKESKAKISKSSKGRIAWNRGIKSTEETKEKQSKAKLGKKLSPDHIEKIAESNKGRKNTDQAKANIKAGWEKRKSNKLK